MSFKESTFAHVIEEHLDLKRKNSQLESDMPLDRYRHADPFENHPLFKTEEQARLEETLDGVDAPAVEDVVLAWPVEEKEDVADDVDPEESLWGRSRDFDWGD